MITGDDISADLDRVEAAWKPQPGNVFAQLLDKVEPVEQLDTSKLAGQVVKVVDELHRLANENNRVFFVHNGCIYVYDGAYWKVAGADSVRAFLGKAAECMGMPAQYHKIRDELFKQFMSAGYTDVPDRPDVLINLKNGTLVVSKDNHELKPHCKQDFLTYQLPFNYDPQANAPMFEAFLNEVLPDKDTQNVLAEFIAYALMPSMKLEKALILLGEGANGKSVFFDIVVALLGHENVSSYSLRSLTDPKGYQRAELEGKLLNYATEINGKLEADFFKQLASSEPVEARRIYGTPYIMKDYARLAFNCNDLPHGVEITNGYFRRFLIIPFDISIPPERQDHELAQKIIKSELPGILNWVIKGLDRLKENGRFTRSKVVDERLKRYRIDADSVALFVEEYECKPCETPIPFKEVYAKYKYYCTENGFCPCNKKKFKNRLGPKFKFDNIGSGGWLHVWMSIKKDEIMFLH